MSSTEANITVTCQWATRNKYLVNPDGQVLPCCYLANLHYYAKQLGINSDQLYSGHKAEMAQNLMAEYNRLADDNNINNKDISEIMNGEWFSKILPESWESEDTLHVQCKRMCSNAFDEKEDIE